MALTLINVNIRLHEQDGDKMEGATVTATLTRTDADSVTGMVIPEVSSGVTDSNGELTLPLWPNTLGKYGSQYIFTIHQLTGKVIKYGSLTLPHLDDFGAPITDIFLSELDDGIIDATGPAGVTYTKLEIDDKDAAVYNSFNVAGGAKAVGNAAIHIDTKLAMVAASWLEVGDVVSTAGYDAVGDLGYATYRVEVADNPDGYLNHLLDNGLQATFNEGIINVEQAGVLYEGVDTLPSFAVIIGLNKPIRCRSSGKYFDLSDRIFAWNESIDIDMGMDNWFVSVGDNERIFEFRNNLRPTLTLTDVVFNGSTGRTEVTVTEAHDYIAGDVLKLFSNQNINPYSAFDTQRAAEMMVVDSVDGQVISLVGRHVWTYLPEDNPRCAALTPNTLRLANINVTRFLPHFEFEFTVAIDILGYSHARLIDIYSNRFTGILVNNVSGYRNTFIRVHAQQLDDDTSVNSVGYVGLDKNGSTESRWYELNGGNIRHTYTTGSDSIPADTVGSERYGGAFRCHVMTGITTGCSNFAYDTHQDAFECEFHDITVYDAHTTTYSASGGFQDRAQNTLVHKMTFISDDPDNSARGTGVLYNQGSHNCHIKELFLRPGVGKGINSFGAGFGADKHAFRIDHIIYTPSKALNNLISIDEELHLDIGVIDVYPNERNRGYVGSGGALIKLGGHGTLFVKEINIHWDDFNLIPITGSSNAIIRIDAPGWKNVEANINTYCTNKTQPFVDGNMKGLSSDDAAKLDRGSIVVNTYVRDNVVGLSKDTAVIFGLDPTSDLRFTYNMWDGLERTFSTKTNLDDTVFLPAQSTKLEVGSVEAFGVFSSQGKYMDEILVCKYNNHSSPGFIGEMPAPNFPGQKIEFYCGSVSETPLYDIPFHFDLIPEVRNSGIVVVPKGSMVTFLASFGDDLDGLKWELYL